MLDQKFARWLAFPGQSQGVIAYEIHVAAELASRSLALTKSNEKGRTTSVP